jgi:hypothetical protein
MPGQVASSVGSLTIVNANRPSPDVFWKGQKLGYLLSATSFYNPPAPSRVTIRVVAPGKVSPPLTAEAQLVLTALYDEMIAAGITVLKV